jgi:hypothetical protein
MTSSKHDRYSQGYGEGEGDAFECVHCAWLRILGDGKISNALGQQTTVIDIALFLEVKVFQYGTNPAS